MRAITPKVGCASIFVVWMIGGVITAMNGSVALGMVITLAAGFLVIQALRGFEVALDGEGICVRHLFGNWRCPYSQIQSAGVWANPGIAPKVFPVLHPREMLEVRLHDGRVRRCMSLPGAVSRGDRSPPRRAAAAINARLERNTNEIEKATPASTAGPGTERFKSRAGWAVALFCGWAMVAGAVVAAYQSRVFGIVLVVAAAGLLIQALRSFEVVVDVDGVRLRDLLGTRRFEYTEIERAAVGVNPGPKRMQFLDAREFLVLHLRNGQVRNLMTIPGLASQGDRSPPRRAAAAINARLPRNDV